MEKTKRKQKIIISLILTCIIAISFFGGYFVSCAVTGETNRTLNEIIDLMNEHSVAFDGVLSTDTLADGLVKGVLSNDSYANYFSANEYQNHVKESSGYFKGIGLNLFSNEPTVFSVNNNSPAQKAGILKGDRLLGIKLAVENSYTEVTSTSQVESYISSLKVGQSIKIKLNRSGTEKEITVSVNNYVASYVTYYDSETEYSFVSYDEQNLKPKNEPLNRIANLPLDTAYIKFTLFEGKADYEFKEAMNFMKTQGRTKLILDLRDNLGGYMEILTSIASYLVDSNQEKMTIAIAKGKDSSSSFTTSKHNFNSNITDIVVIANGYTASAAECLIGAMTYYGSGNFSNNNLLITKNNARGDYSTYGKGIMQTTYTLSNGGALKLTTANIYWPDNTTCIHGKGIAQLNTLNQVTDDTAISRGISILSSN